ncbi:MAG: membrane protein, putative membrane protein [Thaumarchaeota archaeon CSP1-1]|nr:MAG: membrane protein, putative membrane protein [Thaumarchaeota archaeon CSP1-1]
MTESYSDVSKIHKRYSLTLLNPSSFYHSLIISIIIASVLVTLTVSVYLESEDIVFRLLAVLGTLLVTQIIDSRFTRNKEYSKALHMSLFGNSLWLLTAVSGLLASLIISREEIPFLFITVGMFLFASFRIGIFTTVLGTNIRKAWLVCFLQPMAMFLALVPIDMWIPVLTNYQAIAYGTTFLILASSWSILTDRAGMPGVKSTHKLIQAYLSSLSKNNPSEVENILTERAKVSKVSTSQIRFHTKNANREFRLVLPDIHPGPFHPVGGSNIPYLIYKNLGSSAMVLHSVSNHSLNLPSQTEVSQYLESLSKYSVAQEGLNCTEPVTVQINNARCVGLLFGKTALLFLSLSPHGMEDLPLHVKSEIEQFSKNRNFGQVLIVDCHNAMGEEISQNNSEDLLTASKSCLDTLMTKETYPLEFGYANSKDMDIKAPDLALGGIGILCLRTNNKKYFLGWADANNMENGVREAVVNHFSKNGYDLIEICTSDTHYTTQGVRNRNGYYQFGLVTKPQDMANWYLEIAKESEKNIEPASFEILENEANVKVMGPTIFRDYSRAVDKTMNLTKGFLSACSAFFLLTMFL